MATIYPKDDTTLRLGQKVGRAFVASGPGVKPLFSVRKDDVPKPLLFLGVAKGCACGEDRRYGRSPLPRRAGWAFEPDFRKPWLGKPREVGFELIVLDGEPLAKYRWMVDAAGQYVETSTLAYFTLWQWAGPPIPGTGAVNCAPQCAIDLQQIGPDLCLTFKTHTELLPGKTEWVPWRAIETAPPVPIARGTASHAIKVQFQDGFGRDGWMKAWVNGNLVCDYVGQTGFKDHGNLYGAIQAYASESPIETRLRVRALAEGPIGAVETTW